MICLRVLRGRLPNSHDFDVGPLPGLVFSSRALYSGGSCVDAVNKSDGGATGLHSGSLVKVVAGCDCALPPEDWDELRSFLIEGSLSSRSELIS